MVFLRITFLHFVSYWKVLNHSNVEGTARTEGLQVFCLLSDLSVNLTVTVLLSYSSEHPSFKVTFLYRLQGYHKGSPVELW